MDLKKLGSQQNFGLQRSLGFQKSNKFQKNRTKTTTFLEQNLFKKNGVKKLGFKQSLCHKIIKQPDDLRMQRNCDSCYFR